MAIKLLTPVLKHYPKISTMNKFRWKFSVGPYTIAFKLTNDSAGPRFIEIYKFIPGDVRLHSGQTTVISKGQTVPVCAWYNRTTRAPFTITTKKESTVALDVKKQQEDTVNTLYEAYVMKHFSRSNRNYSPNF